jgi:NDP-sugar pyrophosphorylase family protein
MQMPSVVLTAAGHGSRFAPLAGDRHKSTMVVCGQPLIAHALRSLIQAEFTHCVVILNPEDHVLRSILEHMRKTLPKLRLDLVEQPQPTGTGDALLCAAHLLQDTFFVISPYHTQAGSICRAMLEQQHKEICAGVIAVSSSQQSTIEGLALTQGTTLQRIIEKPSTDQLAQSPLPHLAVRSVYALPIDILTTLQHMPSQHYSFESAISQLAMQQRIHVHQIPPTKLSSLKYPWHLLDHMRSLVAAQIPLRDPTAVIAPTAVLDESEGPIVLGPHTRIGHAARILGPCYIGNSVNIGDYCLVRHSSVEAGATIGAHSECVRSYIGQTSTYHFGYIADSVIADQVQIGAGIITANKRLDREPIRTMMGDKKINTQRTALGCVMGTGVRCGIRTNTMPGVIIGEHATIYPTALLVILAEPTPSYIPQEVSK